MRRPKSFHRGLCGSKVLLPSTRAGGVTHPRHPPPAALSHTPLRSPLCSRPEPRADPARRRPGRLQRSHRQCHRPRRTLGTAQSRRALSDAHGEFRLDDLAPGPYRVTVTATASPLPPPTSPSPSASSATSPSPCSPRGQRKPSPSGSSSSITTQTIDLSSAVHGSVVSSQDLETLPLPARSFANIAYLAPGTEPVEPSDPTKARITAVSTGGSSGLNNELSVDGGDNSDDYIGGFLQNYSPDSIQEFAIRTANEDADTGGTTAGSIVITTKSGTNDWHGDAAFYERAAALNARFPIENPAQPPLSNPKQPFSRQNYVATLGGPIVKDKALVLRRL